MLFFQICFGSKALSSNSSSISSLGGLSVCIPKLAHTLFPSSSGESVGVFQWTSTGFGAGPKKAAINAETSPLGRELVSFSLVSSLLTCQEIKVH